MTYATNAPQLPGESVGDALARRLAETAEKEVWNGTTLIGPHRDDLVFEMGGRALASFASRGQQRTAILAFKLAELDLLTALDGRPPLLLLDDVFSELDPERRAHLVRRIAALPQAFVTTTTLEDLDPALRSRRDDLVGDRRRGRDVEAGGERRRGRGDPAVSTRDPGSTARRRRPDRIGDLLPDAARQLGLEDELRFARAMATWDAIVAERVPPAVGACRLERLERDAIVVQADEPIVAAELRMRAIELLAAFSSAPGASACTSCGFGPGPEAPPGRAGSPRV